MTTVTIPRRDSADPLEVIDPTGVKDSTAGLQRFISQQPNGTDIDGGGQRFAVNHGLRLPDGSGKTLRNITLERKLAHAWRVKGGLCADWQFDCLGGESNMPASTKNPYAFTSPKTGRVPSGAGNGGYDATTEQQGYGYDGQHLKALYGAPWLGLKVPCVLRVLVHGFGWFNLNVTAVAADGKKIIFKEHLPQCPDGTVTWAITTSATKWTATFLPNPAWQPYTPNTGWGSYGDALERCVRENQDPAVYVGADCRLLSYEIVGANENWNNPVFAWDLSDPIPTEFQHGVVGGDKSSIVAAGHIHHVYGYGHRGPGMYLWNRVNDCGRVGFTAHHDGLRVYGGEYERTHGSIWDIEATKPVNDVEISHNTFGGPKGGAWSTPCNKFNYHHNSSTDADIAAGKITTRAPMQGGNGTWGGGGTDIKLNGNTFGPGDSARNPQPAISVVNCNQLEVIGGTEPTHDYFLKARNCTGITCRDNDGGPTSKGQVAP